MSEQCMTLEASALSVAKDYVRTVLYVDNHVYAPPKDDNGVWVPPRDWVAAFARKKICVTLFEYNRESDRAAVVGLMDRADICILDWQMHEIAVTGDALAADAKGNLVDGLLTTFLEQSVSARGPMLVCILTNAVQEAKDGIKGLACETVKVDDLGEGRFAVNSSLRFVVVQRDADAYPALGLSPAPVQETAPVVAGEVNDLADSGRGDPAPAAELTEDPPEPALGYKLECLVDFLLDEFSKMHTGIVPTLLLKIFADIRRKTPELMSWFSPDLDVAYIVESALAAYPEYATEALVKAVLDAIATSFAYQMSNETFVKGLVSAWCQRHASKLPRNLKLPRDNETQLDKDDCEKWLTMGYVRFLRGKLSDEETYKRLIQEDKLMLEAAESLGNVVAGKKKTKKSCFKYARLCNCKSMSKVNEADCFVRLTAGTVISTSDAQGKKEYFLCLQQGCDSLRLSSAEQRPFFFLPLVRAASSDGEIPVSDGDSFEFFIPCRQAYRLVAFHFSATGTAEGAGEYTDVRATCETGKFVFNGRGDEDKAFVWEFDLKKELAMKIADDFAHQFSRVAVDGSEWLRVRGKSLKPLESEPPVMIERGEVPDAEKP